MNFITNKKVFYVDSRNRLGGSNSNFSMQFNITKDDKFTHACIIQALIPKSYYLVISGSNTFQLQEGVSTVTITIPPANYNRRSFQSILSTLLNDNSPNNWIYTISYPNAATSGDTGKFTYSVSGNSSQPSFIFGDDSIFEQLGFDRNSTNTFSGDTITSTNVLKMQREDAIYIHSDLVHNSEGNNILQIVFSASDNPSFSNITYRAIDIEANSKLIAVNTSNIYNFSLRNENGVELDLNGLNIIFSLMLYKKNDIHSVLNDLYSLQKNAIQYFTLKS